MKKTICLIMALVMILALAACGSSAAPAPAANEAPAAEAEAVDLGRDKCDCTGGVARRRYGNRQPGRHCDGESGRNQAGSSADTGGS